MCVSCGGESWIQSCNNCLLRYVTIITKLFVQGAPRCSMSSTDKAVVSFQIEIKVRFCQIDVIKEPKYKEDMRIGDNMK